MNRISYLYPIVVIVLFAMMHTSCNKDFIYEGNDAVLRFSLDTVRFDTVFTEVGSATRTLKVYNDLAEDILIDKITLENNTGFFRINVDGIPGSEATDIRIAANDSIYLFAEVTIDPDMPISLSPYIAEEWMRFETNGNRQEVLLEAWGQNANYLPDRFSNSKLFYKSCDMQDWVWDDPRPYVIYGGLFIDSCNLVIPAGTRVYMHGGVAINDFGVYNDGLLVFLEKGKLTTQGTVEQPVIFEGDRLEEFFDDRGGQWNGIVLGGRGNDINHTIFRNSIVGVRVDSSAQASFDGCEFAFTSNSGLIGIHSEIDIKNSLFYNNGGFGMQLTYGGTYNIDYCTVSNYNNQLTAIRLDNFYDVSLFDEIPARLNPLSATITNTIFVGNDDDELSFVDLTGGDVPSSFSFDMKNCIVQVDSLLLPRNYPNFFDQCVNCFQSEFGDTLFVEEEYDYHLDTLSIAIDKGINILGINVDRDGNMRESGLPDIGCYEFVK